MSEKRKSLHHLEAIMRVLVYIEEHLDGPLGLEELARVAHISSFHFHRIFRAVMGETLQAYVKRLRLEAAQGMLRYSDRPIIEIGLEVGYQSHAGFSKIFKQLIGLSPSRYREHMRPMVETLIERTQTHAKMKVEYVARKEEEVLFVRRTGNYQKTPHEAFEALTTFLESERRLGQAKAFYGMGLDDPHIVEVGKLRFDACVSLLEKAVPKGEVGKKTLLGGPYALFIHKGPYHLLESSLAEIFQYWYSNSGKELADAQPIFEYLELFNDAIPETDRVTKIYLPLKF
ncbi:MAG: AraC family transcriptional regulator [Parachlamydia sp.]|nr:AraC family transcriptional regulator [Parachlamydia sp.]